MPKGNFTITDTTTPAWGTLTAANGYTGILYWLTSGSAGAAFCQKPAGGDNQLSVQIDGFYYQNEGRYQVIDTSGGTISGDLTVKQLKLGNISKKSSVTSSTPIACWVNDDSHDGFMFLSPDQIPISWSNVTGKPGLINSGGMSSQYSSLSSWGTITAANGFGFGLGWDFPGGSDLEFGYKGGQIFMQVDGLFYQNEGAYRVLDMNYYYVNSDRHLKKNISNIPTSSLEHLYSVSDNLFKQFTWKDTGKHSYGLIAQQVKKYIPEAIDIDENTNILSVNYDVVYTKMIAAIFKKVKSLEKENKNLKEMIEKLMKI